MLLCLVWGQRVHKEPEWSRVPYRGRSSPRVRPRGRWCPDEKRSRPGWTWQSSTSRTRHRSCASGYTSHEWLCSWAAGENKTWCMVSSLSRILDKINQISITYLYIWFKVTSLSPAGEATHTKATHRSTGYSSRFCSELSTCWCSLKKKKKSLTVT